MRTTKLTFRETLPQPEYFGKDALLICDRKLLRMMPELRKWSRGFATQYLVTAGEELKSLHQFPFHFEHILKLSERLNPKKMAVVSLGGGTVGDFSGFVASVLKRGVPLIHIPSTWLAAIDSSHGGKNALNVRNGKNQAGTFYDAIETLLIKEVLAVQPKARLNEASGELAKIAILSGGDLAKKIERSRGLSVAEMWKILPDAIQAKLDVVAQDPREKTGQRQTLNLGHTFGHVLETAMKMPHGTAVAQGLRFSLEWSLERGVLPKSSYVRAIDLMERRMGLMPLNLRSKQLTRSQARSLLVHDKKREARHQIRFVFVGDLGNAICSYVTVNELLAEGVRQGLIAP